MNRRPSRRKIQDVVDWLASIDISLYGPCMDTETGAEVHALMDYTTTKALKRYEHIKKGTLHDGREIQ
jgi:hypothetical protein